MRLRTGLLVITMLLTLFGARLFQLQGVDSSAYASRAEASGLVTIDLPAERGRILDRNGVPLAESVAGVMVVADPSRTAPNAEAIAKILAERLHLDYFDLLGKLTKQGTRFVYVARRVPSTLASSVMDDLSKRDLVGVDTRADPLRTYPAGDVAANLIGFMKDNGKPAGGLERNFDTLLAGKNGKETYEVGGGNRIPLGDNSEVKPVNGKDLRLTIDRDVQWYSQRVLREAVQKAKAKSGTAVVLDSRTGELLAFADYPTFDANRPNKAPKSALGSSGLSDVYEPGSVEKVLTVSGLLDAGKVTQTTRIKVPCELPVLDRTIGDWFDHGLIRFTMAGVIARSSNIGTALAAMQFTPEQLWSYLDKFGLGRRTDVGMPGETRGLLPPADIWSVLTRAQVAFGQGLSVNALQMAAAVNGLANGGEVVTPSLVQGRATTASGRRGRHRDHHEAPSGERRRRPQDRRDDGAGHHPGRRHRTGCGHRGLPGRGQDRHRAGGRRQVQLLRRRRPGRVLRRLRAGRQAALHRLRGDQEAAGRCLRRRHRRPRLPEDPELRHAEVRRRADRDHASEHPDPLGTVRRPRRCPGHD